MAANTQTHVAEIWIWGVKFTSLPGTLDQANHAQSIVKGEYPNMDVRVVELPAK